MELIIDILKDLIIPAATAFIGFLFGKKKIKVDMKVDINRIDNEKHKNAKKGIILIMSLYSSRSEKTKHLTGEEIKDALTMKDYTALDIENSNLGHGITSILTHADKLEHCWIIGSCAKDSNTPCSIDYEETFIEYLKKEKDLTCQFHCGDYYAVPLDDDALICNKAYQITNDIFLEAKKQYKLNPKDIIVDVTGGIKSMNLGLILASLHKDRDIQIIGNRYDDKGRLIGEPYPVKIHFKPKIKS